VEVSCPAEWRIWARGQPGRLVEPDGSTRILPAANVELTDHDIAQIEGGTR
jgi:hypothetical protein